MFHMDTHRERLLRLATEAREERGLEKQSDLIRAAKLSRSTVHRFEQGESVSETALRKISQAIGWTPSSAQDVLAGGDPTPAPEAADAERKAQLEGRYRRGAAVNDSGHLVGVVDDMVYKVFMFGAPDAPFEEYDRARRRVFEIFREAGIDIAERRDGTSPGTEPDA
jgi:transcriptional regulator with XRE-family HTH domain